MSIPRDTTFRLAQDHGFHSLPFHGNEMWWARKEPEPLLGRSYPPTPHKEFPQHQKKGMARVGGPGPSRAIAPRPHVAAGVAWPAVWADAPAWHGAKGTRPAVRLDACFVGACGRCPLPRPLDCAGPVCFALFPLFFNNFWNHLQL
jgi:hypothetical protein